MAIEDINKLVYLLIENPLTVFLVTLLYVLFKHREINSFLKEMKRKRVRKYTEYIDSPYIEDEFKEFLKEQIRREQCLIITKLDLEKINRKAFLELAEKSQGFLRNKDLEDAASYFRFKQGKIYIEKNFLNKFFFITRITFMLLLLLFMTLAISLSLLETSLVKKLAYLFALVGPSIMLKLLADAQLSATAAIKVDRFLQKNIEAEN